MNARWRALSPGVKRLFWAVAGTLDAPARVLYRLRNGNGRPLPPLAVRTHVGPFLTPRAYFDGGAMLVDDLERVLDGVGAPLAAAREVLDLACGAGRVSMHLLERYPDIVLTGCDVDLRSIEWADANLPRGRFLATGSRPPLPLEDESFDLVLAYSLWTHLPEPDQMAWLAELRRLLRPSGVAVVTTQGAGAYSWVTKSPSSFVQSEAFMQRLREAGEPGERGFVFVPYEPAAVSGHGMRGIEGEYGMSFQTPAYTRERWSELVTVVDVLPEALAHQDAVVVRRRPAGAT